MRARQSRQPSLLDPTSTRRCGRMVVAVVALALAGTGACASKQNAADPAAQELRVRLNQGPVLPAPPTPAECGPSYETNVAAAEVFITDSAHEKAIATYRAALALSCGELPNYELYLRIALVQCQKPDYHAGLRALKDFECMIGVDASELACYADAGRNPELTDACFDAMCVNDPFDLADHSHEGGDDQHADGADHTHQTDAAPVDEADHDGADDAHQAGAAAVDGEQTEEDRAARVERLRADLTTARRFCLAAL